MAAPRRGALGEAAHRGFRARVNIKHGTWWAGLVQADQRAMKRGIIRREDVIGEDDRELERNGETLIDTGVHDCESSQAFVRRATSSIDAGCAANSSEVLHPTKSPGRPCEPRI